MSSRMGSFKPLLKIGNVSAAERIIRNFRAAGIGEIVLVTGNNAEELEKSLAHLGLVFLRNELYKSGEMFDSVKIGLEYLRRKCGRIFVTPVDVPLFSSDTVLKLLRHKAAAGIPRAHNKTGHPIYVDQNAAAEILSYRGEGGLKGALENLSVKPEYIEVDDDGVVYDMDTREDYSRLVKLFAEKEGSHETT